MICAYYLDIIEVSISEKFSSALKSRILSQLVANGDISDRKVKLQVIPLTKKKYQGKKISENYWVDEDSIHEITSYKFSKFEYKLSGLKEMQSITLEVRGNFASQWVWPFRLFGAVLNFLAGVQGYVSFHGAGLQYSSGAAALLVAPSGTGKTLTYLKWLCEGNRVYHDDIVLVKEGHIFPSTSSICFWEQRYQGGKLPQNMPEFSSTDLKALRKNHLIRFFTRGRVNFALSLKVEDYWPKAAVKKSSKLAKIIQFYRKDGLEIPNLKNLLMADLVFTNQPIIKWISSLLEIDPNHKSQKWVDVLSSTVNELIETVDIYQIGLESEYNQHHFNEVKGVLCQ